MSEIRAIDDTGIEAARKVLAAGGLIVIPTDTVYGVACDPFNAEAVAKLFVVKHRARTKSIQVLVPSVVDIASLGLALAAPLDVLAARFMPGGFSPIADVMRDCALKTVRVTDLAGVTKRTQGVRVPDSPEALRLLRALGPLAATSANRSGEASSTTVEQAMDQLGDGVDLYFDGGATPGPISSTVVAADPHERDGIVILREGVIAQDEIRAAIEGRRP